MLSTSLAKAKAQLWAHVIVSTSQNGTAVTITQDSGPNEGHQVVHVGPAVGQVILKSGEAYIQGNAQAVTGYFGFPEKDASTLAGRWISVPSSDSSFASISDGVSLESALAEIGLDGTLSETSRTSLDGQEVIGVHGANSSPDAGGGTGTLYISVASSLPVEFDGAAPQGSEKVVFSDWGKSVSLQTPANPIPVASIS